MNISQIVVVLIGICAVALVCLSLGGTMGTEWNEAAGSVAVVSVGIGFFAIVVAAIHHWR